MTMKYKSRAKPGVTLSLHPMRASSATIKHLRLQSNCRERFALKIA